MKFEEAQFPVRETLPTQSALAPSSDQQISSLDSDHNNLGLDLVKLAHPPTGPTGPGQSTQQLSVSKLQPPRPPSPSQRGPDDSPDMETAPLARPHAPKYSLRLTKVHQERQQQAGTSQEGINSCLIYMCQEAPNSYWEAMTSSDKEKWLKVSQEEYKGLTEMGVWRLVDHLSNHKTIKCRWTYVRKSDGQYKARLIAKDIHKSKG